MSLRGASDITNVITAVVCNDQVVDGHGNSLQESRPVLWWSFTKTVLAAAALALVRDGKLDLDAPVDDQPYTLRQLLRHTAGVPNYSDLNAYAMAVERNESPWTSDQMLEQVRSDRLVFAPGDGWRYSNTGYLLIRQMIENTVDADLQTSLQQLVLSPLGIDKVSVALTPEDLDETAWGNPSRYHPAWVYHGLLIGPAASAALLLERLLTRSFLPTSLLEEMTQAIPLGDTILGRPGINFGYGMGLMIAREGPAGPSTGHTGAGPTSVAAVYHFPDRRCTVATFAPIRDQAIVEWAAHNAAMAHQQ